MAKWYIEDVAAIVESEGIGYAVTSYLNAESIEDEELRILWKQAAETLGKIEKILEPYMP